MKGSKNTFFLLLLGSKRRPLNTNINNFFVIFPDSSHNSIFEREFDWKGNYEVLSNVQWGGVQLDFLSQPRGDDEPEQSDFSHPRVERPQSFLQADADPPGLPHSLYPLPRPYRGLAGRDVEKRTTANRCCLKTSTKLHLNVPLGATGLSYFKKFNKLSSYPLSDFLSGCFFNENNLEEILIFDIIINFLFTYFRHFERVQFSEQ